MGDGTTDAGSQTASTADAGGEPGFEQSGDAAADPSLPDMRDALPTFDDAYGADAADGSEVASTSAAGESASNGNDSSHAGSGTNGPNATGDSSTGASSGYGDEAVGTRAEGGLAGMGNGQGTLTAAEQVAILDRQLEQSTSEFDGLILAEQNKQREIERERASQQSQTAAAENTGAEGSAGGAYGGSAPAEGGINGRSGGGIAGGGIGGDRGMAPENPAIYAPPEDIPEGSDDDVVARQLREAAMREPDPAIREKLWVEYRKYKGIEAPE